jgi:secondary thiamine-phosphate synthase enzyme
MELQVKTSKRCELVDLTEKINALARDSRVESGVCFIFTPHTTAGLTINENSDPAVRDDLLEALDKITPKLNYKHLEGNSEAHIKSSLIGVSLQVPVKKGKLDLGTWQAVYFCEFDGPRNRKVLIEFKVF